MCSPEAALLPEEERRLLLELARRSVGYGVTHGRPLPVDPGEYPARLQEERATFVTLRLHGELRGCIGTCRPVRPLAVDVAQNAYGAAFGDPRFAPVTEAELPQLDFHLSLLSVPEPMAVTSHAELVDQVRPGVDGLLLECGGHRGTLLPAVWDMIGDAETFVQHVKRKAGLPPDYWSEAMQVYRYTAESIH